MERLKELRVEKGLTQQDLADYLDVSKATYSRYETGVRQPDYTTLLKLSTFFNVSTDYLLGNDHKRNRSTEAYDFEQNLKHLDPEVEAVFHDFANMSEEDFEQAKQFIEFLKSKKKK